MIHLDVPLVFSFGVLFADAAKQQIRADPPVYAPRTQLEANLFQTVFFVWAPLYFMVAYFGWETSHLWWHGDSVADYPLLLPGLIVALTASVNAGFLVGKSLVLRERQRTIWAIYLATAVFCVWWLIAMGDRVSRLGTYREFAAGQAPPITTDPTFMTVLAINLVVTGGALAVFVTRLIRAGTHISASRHARDLRSTGRSPTATRIG
jgi:hypothetical protein